jgi:hypothetical protein
MLAAVPHPPTADDLARFELECIAEAESLERQALAMREQARLFAEARKALDMGVSLLTTGRKPTTLDAMNASPASNALRSKSALKSRHPWPAAVAASGETLAIACERVGAEVGRKVPKTTAMGWYKARNDPGYRPIPADCKRAIKKLYGVDGPWYRTTGE